jgi:hypothetical protein
MKSLVIELVSPLATDGEYTSGTRDMRAVARDFGISISCFNVEVDSDQDGSLEIDESTDQIVWEQAASPTAYVGDNGTLFVTAQPVLRYVRAKFTNGADAQTRFAMTTGVDHS